MHRSLRAALGAGLALCLASGATAQTGQPTPPKGKTKGRVVAFALVEGFAAANSLIASRNPHAFGVVALAVTPVSLLLGRTQHNGILTGLEPALMFAAIGTYNLTLDDDELSHGDVFWRNMAAWNVIVVGTWAVLKLTGDSKPAKPPGGGGGGASDWSVGVGSTQGVVGMSLTRRF